MGLKMILGTGNRIDWGDSAHRVVREMAERQTKGFRTWLCDLDTESTGTGADRI